MSRHEFSTNQGMYEDNAQSDLLPEEGIFQNQTTRNSDPEDGHNMVLGVNEEVIYCSPSTTSRQQKRHCPTGQPQFRSENTPATIEADQTLLACQQLANNHNSANFHHNINSISKLPRSPTTTVPPFDRKSENFKLFEELFQTSLKIHNQLTEDDRINYFHSHEGRCVTNILNYYWPNLGKFVVYLGKKYVKLRSMATAKHKLHKLAFNPANQTLVNFLDELQKLAKDAFGIAAHAIMKQFIYAKLPPHLKKPINQAHLENGTFEEIVTHSERVLESNGLEAPDELQIKNVRNNTAKRNVDGPKLTCHHCKKPEHYKN